MSSSQPRSEEEFAAFYQKVVTSRTEEIPRTMRGYVANRIESQKTAGSGLSESELGKLFHRAFANELNRALAQKALANKFYRSLFHEKEAFAFGYKIEDEYKLLVAGWHHELASKAKINLDYTSATTEENFIDAAKKLGHTHEAYEDGSWKLIAPNKFQILKRADGTVDKLTPSGRVAYSYRADGSVVQEENGGAISIYHGDTVTTTEPGMAPFTVKDIQPPKRWPWLQILHNQKN